MTRKFWIAIGVLLMSGELVQAEDRRTDKAVLVIMTINGEFLWDGVEPEEGNASFPHKGSQTEAEEHMQEIAQLIIRSNPDIVNLVEVENLQALKTFNTKFLAGRGYQPYLIDGKDTETGQDVALLTRIDPENNEIARDNRKGRSGNVQKSVSKNYIARIHVADFKIAFIGLHFLARPLQADRRKPREAQADAIRGIAIDEMSAGYHLVVWGDFNDYDGEASSRDHRDSMPVTNVLRHIRAMKPDDPADDLQNVSTFVPKAKRYTAFYDKNDDGEIDPPQEFTSIDHVLLSAKLHEKVDFVDIPHDHDPRHVTDHFPIVVRLKLAPANGASSTVPVRIGSLLPNPVGDESQNEQATIQNTGTEAVNLQGWKLRDLSGKTWSLDELGVLSAGQEKVIKRRGQPMALNNKGDTVDLIDPTGRVVQTVTYAQVEEGEEFVVAPN